VAKKVVESSSDESSDDEPVQKKAPAKKPVAKKVVESSSDESSDDEPVQKKAPAKKPVAKKPVAKKAVESSSDESSDEEPVKKAAPAKKAPAKKAVESSSDESSDEEPVKKAAPAKKAPAKKAVESSSEEESSEEEPVKKAAPAKKAPAKKEESSDEEEEEEEEEEEPVKKQEIKSVLKTPAPVQSNQEFEVKVRGLSYDASQQDIQTFFSSFCEVSYVKLVTDRTTGRSRGLAFVKVPSKDDLDKALAQNRCEHMGRYLIIEQSEGVQQRPQNNFQSPNKPDNAHLKGVAQTLFVGNLSFNTTQDSLWAFFDQSGGVTDARVAKDQDGNSRGFGHVDFDTPANAEKALSMAGQQLDGRGIRCDLSQPKERGAGGNRGGSFGGGRGGRGGRGGFNNDFKAQNKGTINGF
jgi:nucleolin